MKNIILAFILLSFNLHTRAEETIERPPQYVVVSFDGSKNLDMWAQTLALAEKVHAKFTYFISGVYFLDEDHEDHYHGPHHGAGSSSIGFGGASDDVTTRAEYLNKAHAAGHDIGSHANGHFDGSGWSTDDWLSEFKIFNDLIFNVFRNNELGSGNLSFDSSEVHGFRAPLLATSEGLYKVLQMEEVEGGQHFTYDASQVGMPGYWPEKRKGVWNFPLPALILAGTTKRVVAMDYNMYFVQTAFYYHHPTDSSWVPRPVPEEAIPAMQKQVYDTYMNHFEESYHGNRAPVILGNHFSTWNHSVYWNALIEFTTTVCSRPEVKCVSAVEMQKIMEDIAQDEDTLDAYRQGRFDKLKVPAYAPHVARSLPIRAEIEVQKNLFNKTVHLKVAGPDAKMLVQSGKVHWSLDGVELKAKPSGDVAIPVKFEGGAAHKLSVSVEVDGQEVARKTHWVRATKWKGQQGEYLDLEPQDLEQLPMLGELPGAHENEQ